jgi:hypothetical protein
MTFTDAAAEVLRLVGKPLHYKEITDLAIEKNLLSHVGKSPEVTMGARLAATLKKDSSDNPLIRVKPGVFALREWDDSTIKAGLDSKKSAKKSDSRAPKAVAADADGGDEELLLGADAVDEDDDAEPLADDELVYPSLEDEEDAQAAPIDLMRVEAVAGASEMFDEEEDDDQPILGGADRAAPDTGDGRRRRRRRRRGRGGAETTGPSGGLPSYTATPVEGRADGRDNNRENRDNRDNRSSREARDGDFHRGPQVIELNGGDGTPLDDLGGRELAESIALILQSYDRGAGPVSFRQIAEAAQKRGRLAGDAQLLQSQVAAAVRADNARRLNAGQRPRFRFVGGRVALTDWLLGGDLARLEGEAIAAVERYRDAARRALARKLGELPGHAFVELCLLVLEKVGMSQLRAVRRAGSPGGEAHFSAVQKGLADEVRVAIVIRRDGREIGRERVTELRGSLHHYGSATLGWILTAGQVLSGAREEAAIVGTAPVAVLDGLGLARLCEDNDVAVIRARLPIAIPDVDLLEALRAV